MTTRAAPLCWIALAAIVAGCEPARRDIVLITLDTLRRDHVGAYGDDRSLTPRLDALAAEGLVHDAAYTTMPTTAPAHASLFTGLYPSEHRSRRNGEPLPPDHNARELGVRLRDAGYATAAFVSTRLVAQRATGLMGFDIYDSPRREPRHGRDVASSVIAWLDVEKRRPLFVWIHLYDAHAPYGTPEQRERDYPVDPEDYGFVGAERYDDTERSRIEQRYAEGVRSADAALGALVDAFRSQLDQPLVIAVADHGESLGEHLAERGFAFDHGEFLDRECIAIPLVVAGPDVEHGRSPGVASIRDLYATILAAAGVEDADRDLRRAAGERRVVRIERRRTGAAVRPVVATHASAATDGHRLVVLSADGTPTIDGPVDLVEAARAGLKDAKPPAAAPDAETLRALRDLGYAE